MKATEFDKFPLKSNNKVKIKEEIKIEEKIYMEEDVWSPSPDRYKNVKHDEIAASKPGDLIYHTLKHNKNWDYWG